MPVPRVNEPAIDKEEKATKISYVAEKHVCTFHATRQQGWILE